MHVGRDKVNFKYTMKGNTLHETSLEKDLGVVISDNGKTLSQCQYVHNKAIQILGTINRTIKYKESNEVKYPALVICSFTIIVFQGVRECYTPWRLSVYLLYRLYSLPFVVLC